MYAKTHYFPHTSEIAFRSSHWRIDGIGTSQLFNPYLSLLAHPRTIIFGDEGIKTSPSPSTKPPPSPQPPAEKPNRKPQLYLVTNYANNLPSIGLTTSIVNIPAASARCILTFSRERTAAIIAACKARDFTVTTAVHAAIVSAISFSTLTPRSSGESLYFVVDVRSEKVL